MLFELEVFILSFTFVGTVLVNYYSRDMATPLTTKRSVSVYGFESKALDVSLRLIG